MLNFLIRTSIKLTSKRGYGMNFDLGVVIFVREFSRVCGVNCNSVEVKVPYY